VAVKGIGGFHLACDASSEAAVEELRRRKRRDHKPFAVMARDAAAAEKLAELGGLERLLLCSSERPIVLAPRRAGGALAEAVAPDNPLVGLLLPYTPLHHLLLAEVDRPLVMTSGNLSEEPIVYSDGEALEQLGAVADLFLLHDREIAARCDDSVVRVIAGEPVLLRRARGHVPRAVPVREGFERPVLACGADLKNACCLAVDGAAWFGPHVGDLENLETFRSFEESVERMERFLHVRPEIVAHDLHPDLLSTAYAGARPETIKIGVQHHHAHVASVMAEHGLDGPVLGVAYDGTGYGTDGTAWGGEILIAGLEGFERVATFRALPLPGGDLAVRQVWRLAAALLDDAFAGDPPLEALPLFRAVPERSLRLVRQMAARGLNSPRAHGVGRYFDAMGALFLERTESHYEGQVAMAWNFAADASEKEPYPFESDMASSPWTVDLRPMVREAVSEYLAGHPSARISGRFHATLGQATVDMVSRIADWRGHLPAVLAGGCFQNALLTHQVLERLPRGFPVYRNREAPPGDGGIALGQALVANALARTARGTERRNNSDEQPSSTERVCASVSPVE
jgi:hydrogenase maturation protein HypF